MRNRHKKYKHENIKRIIHYLFNFHFLTGWNLINVDPKNYPYCEICGIRPKENYSFHWFDKKYVKIRNIVKEYEKETNY